MTHLEVCGILKGAGAELQIVIAKPLQSDEHFLTRLLDKIEGYLRHTGSKEFANEAGEPDPSNTTSSSTSIQTHVLRLFCFA